MSRAIPLRPSTQVKGGGGFDDIDIEIVDAIFKKTDFVKKDGTVVAQNVTVAQVTYKAIGNDEVEPFHEEYTTGATEPSEDGETASTAGEYVVGADTEKEFTGLTDNSKFGFFLAQLGKAGCPDSKMDASIKKTLIGIKGHLRNIPGPDYGKGKPQPVKVITKLISLPGDTAAASSDASGAAKSFIAKVLEKNNDVPKVKLGQAANKHFAGKIEQVDVVKLVLDDKFLKGLAGEGRIVFANGVVSRAEEAGVDLS